VRCIVPGRRSRPAGRPVQDLTPRVSRENASAQAVILAGGLGTRLRPLTRDTPKSLVEIDGQPFLLHLIALLRESGIRRLVLLVGHLAEKVEDAVGGGDELGVSIRYSVDSPTLLGTGGALKRAEPLLDASFVVVYGDCYHRLDYRALLRSCSSRSHPATVVVNRRRQNDGNVRVTNGLVTAHAKCDGSRPNRPYNDEGVLVLRRSLLEAIPEGARGSIEQLVLCRLILRGELRAHPSPVRSYEVGSPAGLRRFRRYAAETGLGGTRLSRTYA
jgi:N-acetyl-alpha-D-muramate 1-phosphate uridylyltransferase